MKARSNGIILSYLNTFLSMICGLFLSSFLLKQIGDTDYGIYQSMASFANYLVLLEFGTGTVIARNISICRAKGDSIETIEENISTIWTVTAFLSIVILLVSVIFCINIDTIYAHSLTCEQQVLGKKIFIVITVYLLASFIAQTLRGIPLSFEDYSFSPKISIFRTSVKTTLLVVLMLKLPEAIIIALVDAGLAILISVYTFLYCQKKFKISINFRKFRFSIFKSALPFCIAIFLQAIVNQANNNIGKFILSIKLGPEEVALYSVGMYIYSIFSSITTIPVSMYLPQITGEVTKGKNGIDLTQKLVQPSRLIVLIGGTILFGFISAGKPFISLVYGPEYMLSWQIAIILMVPMFINMTTAPIINVLDVLNKRLVRSGVLFICAILNIILTLYLSEKYGLAGIALATGVCLMIGQVFIMNIYYAKVIDIKVGYLYVNAYKGIVFYQIIGAFTAYILAENIKNNFFSFILSGIIYVLISFGGYFIKGITADERKLICGLINKINSRINT